MSQRLRRGTGEGPTVRHTCFCSFSNTGFELTYCGSGNSIHFSFFTMQFFPPSLKITIPKHNVKMKKNFLLQFQGKAVFY